MIELDFQKNQYQTAAQAANPVARLLPSTFFYENMVRVVVRHGLLVRGRHYDTQTWCQGSLAIFRALERIGCQISISGIEHVRGLSGPAVIIGNHMSMLETFLLPIILCPIRRITFILKEGLLRYPYLGDVLRAINAVAVGRVNPREDLKVVMSEGRQRLDSGLSVLVFPQTTRSHSFDPQQMNSIGVKLAKKAGVPVVPLALRTDALQNGKILKDLGSIDPKKPIHFAFGAPLQVEGKGTDTQQQLIDFITAQLQSWAD